VLLAVAVGMLLPFLTRPPAAVCEQYRGWAGHLVGSAGERWPGFRDAWTAWLLVRHAARGEAGLPALRQPIDAPAYRAVQGLGGLAVLAGCLRLRRRGVAGRALVTETLALGTAWLMLLGPAVEAPTYVFLAPFLAWAVVQRGGRLVGAAAVLVLVLGLGGLTRPLWDVLPWLVLVLPAGSFCFLLALVRGRDREGAVG
jgi:hypothetical protein